MKWKRDFNWVGHSEILCIDLGINHGCRHILASAVVTLEVLVSHLMRLHVRSLIPQFLERAFLALFRLTLNRGESPGCASASEKSGKIFYRYLAT